MQILIKNGTTDNQTVQLFPKADYLKDSSTDLYMYSDIGNGDYEVKEFDLEPDESNTLFMTSKINQAPFDLALSVFDSIYIISSNEDKTIMKFYPDSAIGYTENPFDPNSTWAFENIKYDEGDNFNRNPVESDDYTFVVSSEE